MATSDASIVWIEEQDRSHNISDCELMNPSTSPRVSSINIENGNNSMMDENESRPSPLIEKSADILQPPLLSQDPLNALWHGPLSRVYRTVVVHLARLVQLCADRLEKDSVTLSTDIAELLLDEATFHQESKRCPPLLSSDSVPSIYEVLPKPILKNESVLDPDYLRRLYVQVVMAQLRAEGIETDHATETEINKSLDEPLGPIGQRWSKRSASTGPTSIPDITIQLSEDDAESGEISESSVSDEEPSTKKSGASKGPTGLAKRTRDWSVPRPRGDGPVIMSLGSGSHNHDVGHTSSSSDDDSTSEPEDMLPMKRRTEILEEQGRLNSQPQPPPQPPPPSEGHGRPSRPPLPHLSNLHARRQDSLPVPPPPMVGSISQGIYPPPPPIPAHHVIGGAYRQQSARTTPLTTLPPGFPYAVPMNQQSQHYPRPVQTTIRSPTEVPLVGHPGTAPRSWSIQQPEKPPPPPTPIDASQWPPASNTISPSNIHSSTVLNNFEVVTLGEGTLPSGQLQQGGWGVARAVAPPDGGYNAQIRLPTAAATISSTGGGATISSNDAWSSLPTDNTACRTEIKEDPPTKSGPLKGHAGLEFEVMSDSEED